MRPVSTKEIIACRCARELRSGEVVNLGIGIPTLTANYLPQHLDVTFHTENGAFGFGARPSAFDSDSDFTNAGCEPITLKPGAAIMDLTTSFGRCVTVISTLRFWAHTGRRIGQSRELGLPSRGQVVAGHRRCDGSVLWHAQGDRGVAAHWQGAHLQNTSALHAAINRQGLCQGHRDRACCVRCAARGPHAARIVSGYRCGLFARDHGGGIRVSPSLTEMSFGAGTDTV